MNKHVLINETRPNHSSSLMDIDFKFVLIVIHSQRSYCEAEHENMFVVKTYTETDLHK